MTAEPLDVGCPICSAAPGEPCHNILGGVVTNQLMAHLCRQVVAEEDSQ